MAICSFGPIIDGARGSVGGVTFSRAGSGATVRAKPRPPRPVRERQVEGQSYLAQAAALWAALDITPRGQWRDYATSITLYDSLARAYHPTGRQAFVWSYCVRASGGISLTMDAPTGVGLSVVPTLTFGFTAHELTLTSWVPTPHENSNIVLMVYRADRPRAFNRRTRKSLSLIQGDQALPYTLDDDIDETWPVGTELTTFVGVRKIDEVRRLSTRLMQRFYFEVV